MSFINTLETAYSQIVERLGSISHELHEVQPVEVYGRVISAIGTTVIANVPNVKIGDMCTINDTEGSLNLLAEVVAIRDDGVRLLPYGSIERVSRNSIVKKRLDNFKIKLGDFILGKILDGLGNVVSSLTDDASDTDERNFSYYPIMALAPDPFSRPIISEQFLTGVRAIDLFISSGRGQRLAIFAGAGMGKTTLMGMIIRNSNADVIVVSLIGERGREVQEFIDLEINADIRSKCVMVVVTSDRPPVEQVKSAYVAHTVAEYFRDQGKSVLLFTDSITRFARAGREVALSAGEAIARGGYPPSVFLSFPRLMERAGNNDKGSITAFYTVLMEGNDINDDPIANEIKSIIDGHIILDMKLVEQGHFPAINLLKSLSRIADRIIDSKHLSLARKIRLLLAKYEELEFLIRVGEYQPGADKVADEAIAKHDSIMQFLKQAIHELSDFSIDLEKLASLAN